MKKFILPTCTLAIAIVLSAFSTATKRPAKPNIISYFYLYSGPQTIPDRENGLNYWLSPHPSTDPFCAGSEECCVEIAYLVGSPPENLLGQGLTFDQNGFPTGVSFASRGIFLKNEKQP